MRLSNDPPYSSVARVAQRRQELVNADTRAPRGLRRRRSRRRARDAAAAANAATIAAMSAAESRPRRGIVVGERLGRRPDGLPAAVGWRHRPQRALPRQRRAGLAAGVRELDGRRRSPAIARTARCAPGRRRARSLQMPRSVGADAAFRRDRRRFGHRSAAPPTARRAEMHEVPVVREPVAARVLAHRRDDDAIGEREAADGHRIEQVRHAHHSRLKASGMLRSETDLCSATSRTAYDHHQRARLRSTSSGTCVMTSFENIEERSAVRARSACRWLLLFASAIGPAPAAAQEPPARRRA